MEELAINGGPKTRTRPLPSRRDIGAEELKEIIDVIWSGQLNRVGGTKVIAFEREFANLYGVKHAIASTSGTAAIHVALGAINPEPCSEIITGPISDIGSVIPILYQNCIPIFADIELGTYGLDPDDVERKITDRTVAVLAIHLFGLCGDMDRLSKICKEHGIYLIEDCSQAHLAEYKGRLAGTIGDFGCFSLQQSKQITCGDGGVTITNNDELADRARLFADKAWPRGGADDRGYLFLAMNYRMTELQGAVALAQVRKAKDIVARRRRAGDMLTKLLKEIEGVKPPEVPPGSAHSYWLYPFTIDREVLKVRPEEFARALSAEGIPASVGYIKKPLYLFKVLKEQVTYGSSHCPFDCPRYGRKIEYREGDCPNAERILKEIITIPINEFYTEEDINDIFRAISKVANYYRNRNLQPCSS
ncbi:MAG: DegT/DnrJ/EryC1/StrS family aminotransferase [Candidatus Bathyarchaeia archaeon]